ncbi:MAG: abhydrolase domain-containing 18, partial [Acidobacteria bacterium]
MFLQPLFHAWERRLASRSTDRVVRPFDWGLDWIPRNGHPPDADAAATVGNWVAQVMADSDGFFTPAPTTDYTLRPGADDAILTFPSAFVTPHAENNTVYCRYFPARSTPRGRPRQGKAAVLVLPQWNSDSGGHVGLCRLMSWNGMSALRLSLPYHHDRMPSELRRADYIVSPNIVRTLQVCRQAVLDARRAVAWLARQGYDRIGILGTSLGSCLSLLTTAHEPLIRAQALNHVSPHFADVVWRGLSTRHVREGLDGHIDL